MKKTFWQTRLSLVFAGVMLGWFAQAILGQPEPDIPPGPAFDHPLPDEVPFSIPLEKKDGPVF